MIIYGDPGNGGTYTNIQLLTELNYTLPVVTSSSAYVSKNAQVGDGTIIMHGTIAIISIGIFNKIFINKFNFRNNSFVP